ncbi:Hypothetical leucine rich repeat protein [Ectocarpus siliculosus]|uniref:Hypothetical leucine rich repeat protein n=1 Tax=Ectocarpus siliculosus TaxID=2880 RepID=D8LGJ5_ECTSI|nr:Hypothetical leucine rich repeat protein [Ectocarpus siliculosus]|eukprot:CBN79052.1 Hypothetical leucine rich repeat protein [Ectocarpus siliculosus]
MFITRLRRKTQIRRRKGERETLIEDAVRFQELVVSKIQERGVPVPSKLLRELQRGSEQRDGGKRLYKLDLRRTHLTDAHVEALAQALQELPVVRKLDLRGNEAVTIQALNALNSLLKGQVELFRLVQADASLADSSLSFLYSVKLDATVLSLDRRATEELEAQTAALEVADSVLDVRHAFFQADVRGSGTLTEHELSGAMRIVMGVTPKAAETSRVLRFFGAPGAQGNDPNVINLGGFEAAMVGRLRESHTLPVLPQRRDDLLFGSAGDKEGQESLECFSPWSTRSFGATTGGIRGDKVGGGGVGNKRSPLSASQKLSPGAGMGTHVLSLPPWRGGEGGSELSNTQNDDEGQSQRAQRGDADLENIFDDDNCDEVDKNDGAEDAAAPRRVRETSRTSTRNSGNGRERSNRGARSSTSSLATDAREEKEERHQEPARQRRQKEGVALVAHENSELMSSAARLAGSRFLNSDGGGDTEDDVLSDCSSDDDLSCTSARAQSTGKGTVNQNGGRLRTEHPNFSREETGGGGGGGDPKSNTEKTSNWRRHSSNPAAQGGPRFDDRSASGSSSGGGGRSVCFSEDRASGDRRVSDASRSSHSGDDSALEPAGSGASTHTNPGRRHSILKGNQGRDDGVRRNFGDETPPSTPQTASVPGRGDAVVTEPATASRSNAVRAHQTGGVRTNLISEEGNVTVIGMTEPHKEAATSSAASSRAEPPGEEPATRSRLAQASPLTTTNGGGSGMPAGRVLLKASDRDPHPRGVVIVDGGAGGVLENDRVGRPAGLSLEAIVEAPGSGGGGDGGDAPAVAAAGASTLALDYSGSGGGNSGPIRMPYCLSPTNVVRQARGGSGAAATAGSSCRERESLAARIQRLGDINAAATANAVNPAAQNCSVSESGFAALSGHSEGGGGAAGGSPQFFANAEHPRLPSSGGMPTPPSSSHGGMSPERSRSCGLLIQDGGGGGSYCSSPSPSSRFHLPSSETKTAPLYSAGGSTSLFEGQVLRADSEPVLRRAAEMGSETKGKAGGGEGRETDGMLSSPAGALQLDEEQLGLRINEGALVITRTGLSKMSTVLQLEAVYGYGRESLIGLHTLVLSYNQLQVLDISVLTTMPALRHLDVSHNLLCRMEPMDGRDLPPRLETLNMSHNRISRIGGIAQCFLLRALDLRHNRIKRVQGLEHLSLLLQLDLGHNFISKAASARALSFNRSLKLLWLEGNPLARHPRYRPTLTCLLPHVRSIDSRAMPPSSDSDQRRWEAGGGSADEEEGGDGCSSTVAAAGHAAAARGHQRGRSGNTSASREWQAEQDTRRSKEWQQVMEWRKGQARREEEAKGQALEGRHDVRQAINAAQQRRQAEELARPRPRKCPSEEAISKAKEVACRRPAVVFGISYRGERERGTHASDAAYAASAGMDTANTPPSPPRSKGHQQHGRLFDVAADGYELRGKGVGGGCGGGMDRREEYIQSPHGAARENGAVSVRDVLGRQEWTTTDPPLQDNDESLQQAYQNSGSDAPPPSYLLPSSRGRSSKRSSVGAVEGHDSPTPSVPVMMTVDSDGAATARTTVRAKKAPEDIEGASAESSGGAGHERNELVDSWLLDVKLETETAGTALQVLLRMCKERGGDTDGERRRLSSFRTALEGMGLFSPQHGPTPTEFVGDEAGVLAHKVAAAARQVAMTKAAVKNLLRLMESVEPGEDGKAELDQYAKFIRLQREIMIGVGGHPNADTSSPETKREPTTSAAVVQQGENANCHRSLPEQGEPEGRASGNPGGGVALPSSSSLYATATTAAREGPTSQDLNDVSGSEERVMTTGTEGIVVPPCGGAESVHETDANDVIVPLGLGPEASARCTGGAIDAASKDVPGTFQSITCEPLRPAEEVVTEEALVTMVVGITQGKDSSSLLPSNQDSVVVAGIVDQSSISAGVSEIASAVGFVHPKCTSANKEKNEGREASQDLGDYAGGNPLISTSPAVVSADETSTSTPRVTIDGTPSDSSLKPNGTSVLRTDNGDDADATAEVAEVAEVPGKRKEEGGEGLSATPVTSATSTANLSARERLLRHVRATASPRSGSDDDSSCCSSGGGSGTDNNDSESKTVRRLPTTEGLQRERDIILAQEDGGEEGCDGEVAAGGDGGEDIEIVGVAKQEEGVENSRTREEGGSVDGRPMTTRPATRWEGEGGTEGNDKNELGVSSNASRQPDVPSASPATQLANPLATAEAGSIVIFDKDGSVSSGTPAGISGDVYRVEVDVSAIDTPTAAGAGFSPTSEHQTSHIEAESDTGTVPSTDAVGSGVDCTAVSSAATPAVVCPSTIASDAIIDENGGELRGSTLDESGEVAQGTTKHDNDSEQILSHPVSDVSTPIRSDLHVAGNEKDDKAKGSVEVATAGNESTLGNSSEKAKPDSGRSDEAATTTCGEAEENAEEEVNTGGDANTKTSNERDVKLDGAENETAPADPTTELAWIEGYDPGHDCYYYHHVPTGESRWYKPDEPYESYVHSDEEDGDGGTSYSLRDEGGTPITATTAAALEDDNLRPERKERRKDDENVDNQHLRGKRGGIEEEEATEATTRRSSLSRKVKEPSSGKRRSSKSSTASAGSQGRRRDDDDGGARDHSRSGRASRQQRGKTALERLNDFTDDNTCGSDDPRSDGYGCERRRSSGSSRRQDGTGSRRHRDDDDDRYRSRRKHSSGDGGSRHRKSRGDSSLRTEGYRDDGKRDHDRRRPYSQRRSSDSRYILSSDGSRNSDDDEGALMGRTSSARDRGGSRSRRSSAR